MGVWVCGYYGPALYETFIDRITTHASTSSIPKHAQERKQQQQQQQEEKDGGKGDKTPPPPVPLHRLFYFADSVDVLLMTIGGVAAAGTGTIMPLFSLIFSNTINAINVGPDDERRHNATKYSLYFVGLACVSRTWLGLVD